MTTIIFMVIPTETLVAKPLPKKICSFAAKSWVRLDLNQGPRDYESPALTAELRTRLL